MALAVILKRVALAVILNHVALVVILKRVALAVILNHVALVVILRRISAERIAFQARHFTLFRSP